MEFEQIGRRIRVGKRKLWKIGIVVVSLENDGYVLREEKSILRHDSRKEGRKSTRLNFR